MAGRSFSSSKPERCFHAVHSRQMPVIPASTPHSCSATFISSKVSRPMYSTSSPSPQNPEQSSAVLDDFLACTTIFAALASNVAHLAPVPYLARGLALPGDIATTFQDIRSNRKAFVSLADDAREMIDATEGEPGSKMPGDLIENLRALRSTLEETRDSASKPLSDNLFKRLIRAKTDKSKVDKYRQRMEQGRAVFDLKIQTGIQTDVHKIKRNVDQIVAIEMDRGIPQEHLPSVPAAVQNILLEHVDSILPVLGVCIAFKQAPSVLQISRVLAIDVNQVISQLGYISAYVGSQFDSTNSLADVELPRDLEQWLVSPEHAGELWIDVSRYHSRIAQWCLMGKRTYDVR
ncbi:hypothetical protein MVEN_01655700 [Mycena venus]|uniref:Uncharacterized protein n=1 Tax=Mycena venus TaxID=2733690 RepID=A0A8H6XR24_9AGAR|nr:hypothetical protein MVEN_01655700 [Mycena venus]